MKNWAMEIVLPKRSGRFTTVAALTAVFVAAALSGCWLRGWDPDSTSWMSRSQSLPLEHFFRPKSFSEVENAKALLEALAAQSISELRANNSRWAQNGIHDDPTSVQTALQVVDKGIEEFQGTEQEFLLMNERLILLHQAGLYDRWLDAYLKVAYEHPTQDLVGRNAQRAQKIAQETGRRSEILAAFRHLSSIPLEFTYKPLIQAAMHETILVSQTASARAIKVL